MEPLDTVGHTEHRPEQVCSERSLCWWDVLTATLHQPAIYRQLCQFVSFALLPLLYCRTSCSELFVVFEREPHCYTDYWVEAATERGQSS